MDIGEEKKEITFEPIELPIETPPAEAPAAPAPTVPVPEGEPVGV